MAYDRTRPIGRYSQDSQLFSGSVRMSSISLPPALMPPRGYLAVIRTIDKFTEWTGHLFILFIIPLILSNVIEVFARYVLKEPTIWALDITTMSYAALFMLGSAL